MLNLYDGDRGLQLIIISVVFGSLATVAVALRLMSRRIKRKNLAADDYWIILALVRDRYVFLDSILPSCRFVNKHIWSLRSIVRLNAQQCYVD